MSKLVAAIACRSQGTRLYGKPMQNLDIEAGVKIIDNIIDCLHTVKSIDEIVLGIAEGLENQAYIRYAEQKGIRYTIGPEDNVLQRLIECGRLAGATDIFRVTSESPFPFFEKIDAAYAKFKEAGADAYFFDEVVDGCNFEIVSLKAFETSYEQGEYRHRAESCTLYLRENINKFHIIREKGEAHLHRLDLRLTVDNPEDLVVARAVYTAFKDQAPRIPTEEIIRFLDENPKLIELVAPFTEKGYSSMFVWKEN